MALPKPVWSDDVISNLYNHQIWDTWNGDPATMTVLRAIASLYARLGGGALSFRVDITDALAQQWVCFFLIAIH